jgi:hypothetical protein
MRGSEAALHARAAAGPAATLSPEYREVVDRTVELLRATKSRLRMLESREALEHAAQDFQALSLGLWNDWRIAWAEAAQCLPEIVAAPEQLHAAKDYTEAHLTPELMGAPLWRQAYAKPLGYPGDYVVMDYIYQGSPAGDTPFGRIAHALAVQIGQFVVKRKDLVRQAIAEAVGRSADPAPCAIASLGCGPAREVAEFLALEPLGERPMHFTLVDQDSAALRCAGRNLSAAIAASRRNAPVRVDPRHVSVLSLLREAGSSSPLPRADMIYSAGLLDYFGDRTCRALTQRLYEALVPGGLLLLGNMKAGTDMLWPLELIADWSLRYRTAESVLSWADGLPGAVISLRTEATGYDYLLSVRKA